VEAIARHDAGAKNLHTTTLRIEELVDQAKTTGRKIICFVTGVPGAGKTLVGLNVATQRRERDQPTHAVFLSGNGPLVAVLREALTRDEVAKRKRMGEKTQKSRVANPVKAFIQNVHHFRDEALRDPKPPVDHVVIFDEAQRAWNAKKAASFMRQKKGQPDFSHSEPAFLISCLDRHEDWAAIICLVGGGQEIHSGEAGIWQSVKNADNQAYLRNAYRVLLTRARQGTVVFIPPGNLNDHTRLPSFCDRTYQYLGGLRRGVSWPSLGRLKSPICDSSRAGFNWN
jgi:hypothetical protein